ncbi:MAG TPA: elongation factor P [Acidimicrobiia bacterium]|nr:elongation factor P [Acidimicrobiia bacterium]
MISTNDMRPGMTLDIDGELWSILEYQHHKPGKGHAMVRTKVRSLKSGVVVDRTFRADEKVEVARLDRREMQYLYPDDTGFVFMDNETYEQMTVAKDLAGDAGRFLKEAQTVSVLMHDGQALGVDLPTTVDLVVAQTDPGLQGDRSSAGTKPATLETGAVIQVPLFLTTGETVRVDTRTGSYVTRVRN